MEGACRYRSISFGGGSYVHKQKEEAKVKLLHLDELLR